MIEKTMDYESSVKFCLFFLYLSLGPGGFLLNFTDLTDWEASQVEASSSSGHCCHNRRLHPTFGDGPSEYDGEILDQLIKARNLSMLKFLLETKWKNNLFIISKVSLATLLQKKTPMWYLLSHVFLHFYLELFFLLHTRCNLIYFPVVLCGQMM